MAGSAARNLFMKITKLYLQQLIKDQIEVEETIDYDLVILLDNALRRAKTITGKELFQT